MPVAAPARALERGAEDVGEPRRLLVVARSSDAQADPSSLRLLDQAEWEMVRTSPQDW